jgi:hypothetical protein
MYSGDLLVGNFGDGMIDVFSPTAPDDFLGTLDDSDGNPITIEGLWGLGFGNGGSAGPTSSLYFTAGIPGGGNIEDHGLFGDITVATSPEPATGWMIGGAFGLLLLVQNWRGKSRNRDGKPNTIQYR